MADEPPSFSTYRDMTKQVLTLTTGVLALTLTFLKDVVMNSTTFPERILLWIGWLLLLISIIFGVLTLMAISGALHCIEHSSDGHCTKLSDPSRITVYSSNIRLESAFQVGLFGLGILLLIIFGVKTV